ncbi:MAG: DUF2452 domain-containing protein [Oligoflexales bacterium]|nr:DUF2452 domain-containing protein [Oligoflexales bacterium]
MSLMGIVEKRNSKKVKSKISSSKKSSSKKKSKKVSKQTKKQIQYTPQKFSKQQMDYLERMAADIPGLMEYPHNVGGVAIQPTQEGVIKAQALSAMQEQTRATMSMLAEFMQLAMKHATKVKDRVDVSMDVYRAKINFKPIIGKNYFLYLRENGEEFLSLIAKDEWGASGSKLTLQAEVKLLSDHTWELIQKFN